MNFSLWFVNISGAFASATSFNSDLSQWNFSATDAMMMFSYAISFNSDLSQWQLDNNLANINSIFLGAKNFRQNLCSWGIRLGPETSANNAFAETACPRQEVPNLTAVPPGPFCFSCDGSFDPTPAPTQFVDLTCFVTTIELRGAVDAYLEDPSGGLTATQYGHPISTWCVGQISDFTSLFDADRNSLVVTFNEGLSDWDLSGAITLERMFSGAREFNQDLSSWDTSNVISFLGTFNNCTAFNNDILNWDTSNAGSMAFMFNNATSFSQNIDTWITSNVQFFSAMFQRASSFNW